MAQEEKNHNQLSAEVVQEITQHAHASIERSSNALMSHKPELIETEFSAAFTVAGGDWKFADRADMIERIDSGRVKYEHIKTDVERVDVLHDGVAIVTGTRSVKAVVEGKDFASTFPFKAVHTLEGGQWRTAMWAVNC